MKDAGLQFPRNLLIVLGGGYLQWDRYEAGEESKEGQRRPECSSTVV